MSNKKHIDRVFQENLKDFEVSPNPKVWQKIKDELEQSDQDKKVIPIWLRLAGVAALLLILFTIGNAIVSNTSDSSNNKVVESENTGNTSDNQIDKLNTDNRVDDLQNASQGESLTNVDLQDLNSEADIDETNNTTGVVTTSNSESNINLLNNSSDSETINDAINNSKVAATNSSESNTNLVNNTDVSEFKTSNKTTSSKDKNNYSSTKDKTPKTNKTYTDAVTQGNNVDAKSQTSPVTAQNKTPLNKSSEEESKSNMLPNDSNNGISSTSTMKEGIAQNNSKKQNSNSNAIPELDKAKADATMKISNKDAVVENESNSGAQENKATDEETDKDSPSIEEEIAKAEDIIEEEEKVNRWQVYATIAPVYYNTLGKGSHIDDQFVENSKSGEVNTSYGVNVSYVLNDKLKLRAGFNSLNLSYDTDNVILYENVGNNSSSAAAPRNLDLTSTGQSFSAISATNLGAQQLSGGIGGNDNGAISQRIGYYEVPLELEYSLVDKKFGVNVVGGFSTFILNDNKVYSEFDGIKTEVGEANNINDVSFSGNLGLGLDYKFSDKIKLNVQPTFKYQLNAYKNTSGNFRPYIVGIYTGLSYKF